MFFTLVGCIVIYINKRNPDPSTPYSIFVNQPIPIKIMTR